MGQKARECTSVVTAIRWPTPAVVEVDLRVTTPSDWTFQAGQWISVPFGPKIVRAWSMVSSPTRKDRITLAVDVTPGGIGSEWLRALKVGDAVGFKGATGALVFDRADPRRALFVAEEIGIVPICSILTYLYETGYGRANGLISWGRDPSWLLYDAQFRSLARRYPSFSYLPAVRDAPEGWRAERGEVADIVERLVHSVDRLVVYVCGGGETIQKVRGVLVRKGMDRKSVKWEKFW